jgi:hypothetical protein
MCRINAPDYALHAAFFLGAPSNLLLLIDKKS